VSAVASGERDAEGEEDLGRGDRGAGNGLDSSVRRKSGSWNGRVLGSFEFVLVWVRWAGTKHFVSEHRPI
jgi:hypothetical protein